MLREWNRAIKNSLSRWISGGFFRRPPGAEHLGTAGELEAARFLRKQGYRILAHGHRQRLGEIDLIAIDGQEIVFVEVKTWKSDRIADPSEAVDGRKQGRLTRAALIYLKQKQLLEHPARFDVVSVVWPDPEGNRRPRPRIRHFKNAFEAIGQGQFFN